VTDLQDPATTAAAWLHDQSPRTEVELLCCCGHAST